jgi:hypothetical protein
VIAATTCSLGWQRVRAMGSPGTFEIVVMDGAAASTLSQILPLLLLTLMVELRRTALHRRFSRLLFGVFFLVRRHRDRAGVVDRRNALPVPVG